MKKNRHRHWYRAPKTTQERRANQDGEYVRLRRRRKDMPDSYSDIPVERHDRTWKQDRKTQYRTSKRGQKHHIIVGINIKALCLEEYFRANNIPHVIEYRNHKHNWHRDRVSITWWSDKDIGIDHLLKSNSWRVD